MEVPSPSPTGLVLSLLKSSIKHQDHLLPLVKSYWFAYRKKIRVSMACLIRLEIDGNYFLIRNRHRPEQLAPIGGVIKHYRDAQSMLDHIQFEREKKSSTDTDLLEDLRGIFPAQNFGTFMTWFKSRTGREQSETIIRELSEELAEAKIPEDISSPLVKAKYSLVRVVHHGPHAHDALDYATFRYFEIYALELCTNTEKAIRQLAESAIQLSSPVRLVTKECIDTLRSKHNEQIAGSARCFFSSKPLIIEPTPF